MPDPILIPCGPNPFHAADYASANPPYDLLAPERFVEDNIGHAGRALYRARSADVTGSALSRNTAG